MYHIIEVYFACNISLPGLFGNKHMYDVSLRRTIIITLGTLLNPHSIFSLRNLGDDLKA